MFWPVDWNWSGPRTNPYASFHLFCVCVCGCGQTEGGALELVQIFILVGRLKIGRFLALSVREGRWVQTLWILCTLWLHPFIHPPGLEICDSRFSYPMHYINKKNNYKCREQSLFGFNTSILLLLVLIGNHYRQIDWRTDWQTKLIASPHMHMQGGKRTALW